MKELSALFDELIACGNRLTETALALKEYYSSKDEKVKKEPAQKVEDVPKTFSKEQVRAALNAKAKIDNHKYKPEVKELFNKYSKDDIITGISENDYAARMEELEGIISRNPAYTAIRLLLSTGKYYMAENWFIYFWKSFT